MNRFALALDCAEHQPPLDDLAHNFLFSVEEAMTENRDPNSDPAVMLLGLQIAFHTHADVSSQALYQQLVDNCISNAKEFSFAWQRH